MSLLNKINHYLTRLGLGFQIEVFPEYLIRRQKLIKSFKIACIIDVGANVGQYGIEMRKLGYASKIISFEPLREPFANLAKTASNDQNWEFHNFGLGSKEEESSINVSATSVSSSLLEMLPAHLKAAPYSRYVGKETISIKTIDGIFTSFKLQEKTPILLKIDTQGFENEVLEGAKKSLSQIDTLMLEMSLLQMYKGENTFLEMGQKLTNLGYSMVSIEPGFQDFETGRLLQVDTLWHRFSD